MIVTGGYGLSERGAIVAGGYGLGGDEPSQQVRYTQTREELRRLRVAEQRRREDEELIVMNSRRGIY